MTIVNPTVPPTPIIQTTANPVATSEERQVDLRLEQIVRATVVEGGLDRALLEMSHRYFRAQSDIELQVGQKLTLQVLQTHPSLEFRVLNDPFFDRLSQLLPLLTRPYDWAQLLGQLQQQPTASGLPQATAQVYQQLQQLLQSGQALPAGIEPALSRLPGQLQQLLESFVGERVSADAPVVMRQNGRGYLTPLMRNELLAEFPQLLRGLQQQFKLLPQSPEPSLPQNWLVETRNLLTALQQNLPQSPLPFPQLNELLPVLGQLQQHPSLPQPFAAELKQLLVQLHSSAERPLKVPQQGQSPSSASPAVSRESASKGIAQASRAAPPSKVIAGEISGLPVTHDRPVPAVRTMGSLPPAEVATTELSAGLEKLLQQVQKAQDLGHKPAIPPELLGRLEGFLAKLGQPSQLLSSSPALELLSTQLSQLAQLGPQRPEGGQLGFLSQLFGFHLEAELLQGKKKEALASLKLSLLALQKELGQEVEEPLRRLEMFQLCKAKLAEEQVQFLPLPFNELEEGYLLVENQREAEEEMESEPPLQLSLSLRLSALGNMRIDILYEKQGLHLRLACEDQGKMEYLQGCSAELKDLLQAVPLQGVSFAADASAPTQKLLERLFPEAFAVLDARI
ncbi:MAG: hypothetical protein KAT62_14430 [Desulfuromonadales bacterium]|nr:hypothetical protein [Desulfuromonadales bacterium]